jgi:hypothetical protein
VSCEVHYEFNIEKVIMGRLSAHGVKQMLTPVLASLPEEQAWKSRQEAVRLLGVMANCAPKQLAACLPQVRTYGHVD